MRYLGNDTNLVRDADLSGNNGVGSDAIYRTDTAPKVGGGSVKLTGPYTGDADAVVDVEIVDNAGSTTQVSQPQFTGIGNGTMTDVTATGVDPQTVVVTLENLGTQTLTAYANFQGARLVALSSGSGGNAIRVDVDHSAIVDGDTDWSLQEDMQQDANEYIGDHWDLGAAILEADGSIPADAPRLRFGSDPQVYRAYKRYRDGRYIYSFSPAPVRNVRSGARVHAITGSRTVTITDGVDTETLTGIVTLFDALDAIRSDSDLIAVDGPIVSDRLPGGMGINELSVRTRSYVLGVVTSGSNAVLRSELDIEAADNAPTETLRITCADASVAGSEAWDVIGDVTGSQSRAITGIEHAEGRYTFTIPLAEVDPTQTTGELNVEFIYMPRDGGVIPSLCVDRPRLGAAARDGQWQYTWAPRPPAECDCNAGSIEGGPSNVCLGITPGGGQVAEASQLIRIQRLTAAVRALLDDNTSPPVSVDAGDVSWIEKGAAIFMDCLGQLTNDRNTFPAWAAATPYDQDVVIASGGFRYAATTPGTSGSTIPTFNTTVGATTTDSGVTWTNLGKVPYGMWDDAFDAWVTEAEGLADVEAVPRRPWGAGIAVNSGDIVIPSTPNGHYYSALVSGMADESTTSQFEPAWPTDGGSVTEIAADGSPGIEWTDEGTDTFTTATINDAYFERYRTVASDILAAAGITPNFEFAGTEGDGCWQDWKDMQGWFVYDGSEPYLPIQPGHYYHSSKKRLDENGRPYAQSTQEFGFGPKFGCPEGLINGDQIVVTITGASGSGGRGYQAGDQFAVQVTNANLIPFGGGQTGNDTLTWSVKLGDDMIEPYELITTAPVAYSDEGIEFLITQGAIPFALGDTFIFTIEGGRFRWRRDGGAWSANLDIATIMLSDGLSVVFTGGVAPSWVAGDGWSFAAEATFGVEQLRTPLDGEFVWTGSTVIEIEPDPAGGTVGLLIAGHRIASTATIRLQGSDDAFATTPLDVVVPWRRDCIWLAREAEYARYRVTVNEGGAIRWLYLGESTLLSIGNKAELGQLVKRIRLPRAAVRKALGATVEHSFLTQESVDELIAMLEHATEHDDSLFGIVPNDDEAECGMVRYAEDSLELEDLLQFQPRDPDRYINVTLQLQGAP